MLELKKELQIILCAYTKALYKVEYTPRRIFTRVCGRYCNKSVQSLTMTELADLIHVCFMRVVCYKGYRKDKHNYMYTYCTLLMREIMRKYNVVEKFNYYNVEVIGLLQYCLSDMCAEYLTEV